VAIPTAIEQFLQAALPKLRADERLLGVAAGGSWNSGRLDEYSDLDLVVVTRDESFAEMMQTRLSLAESLHPLLAAFTGEHVGEPRLLICLYRSPLLHVDLKFVSLQDFAHRVEDPAVLWERDAALTTVLRATQSRWPAPDPQWIEDRFWVWIHYAATKLARGELFEVLDMLGFLRAQVLAPLAVHARGLPPQGVRRVENSIPEHLPALEKTVARHEGASCGQALQAAVALYRELRRPHLASLRPARVEAEAAATEYLKSLLKQMRDPALKP